MTKLAYIMGASHSGSTLLAMLLGSHPQAATIGEMAGTQKRKDQNYLCSCGNKARECPFWKKVIQKMADKGYTIDIGDFGTRFEYPGNSFINRILRAQYRGPFFEALRDGFLWLYPDWHRQFQIIARQNVAFIETINEITQSKIFIDSAKSLVRLKFLLRIPELDVKVIHLVRDGRGVARSCMRHYGWSVETAAIDWRRDMTAANKMLSRLDKNMWKQVRYEDLCSNPQSEVEKLCIFLGIDPLQVNMDFRYSDLHVFGNQMRLSSEQAIHLDEKWKNEFTDSDISIIERIAGRQLEFFGYK